MALKRFLVFIFFSCTALALKAQILNDSVRNVYGPNTTLYLLEENIKYNNLDLSPLDTLITGIHNFNFVDRFQRKYQDLGVIGTPMMPVFYTPPDIIGRTSGFHSFDPYFVAPEQVKYYDSKSPYSKLYFIVGGNGRSIVNVDYSRNVKPNWNVGASLQNISADKQLGTSIRRGDRFSDATAYQFYTRYFTTDNKYQLLANFSRLGIRIAESGGLQLPEGGSISDLDRDDQLWLANANSREVRINLHLYHQFRLSDLVQLYHSIDRTNQDISFTIPISENNLNNVNYFIQHGLLRDLAERNFYQNNVETSDQSKFLFTTNEIGFKGDIERLFYNFYLKRRDLRYDNKYANSVNTAENYAGFNIRNDFSKGIKFNAFGEYLLGRNYILGSGIYFKYLEANVKRIRHDPSFLHQSYYGNHLEWNNDFTSIISDNFFGALHLDLPFLKLSPHINLHRVNNPVFFNSERTPQQAAGAARIFSPGIDLNLRFFKNIYFENHFVYTGISGDAGNVFRIPRYFLNSRIYYGNSHFNNKLQIQVGVDMHFRSSYFAYAYEPVIQQFFLQNEFQIPAYPLADVFMNAKIGRARVFVKYSNLTQTINLTGEYFATPYYFGQQGVLDFGVNWLFFD